MVNILLQHGSWIFAGCGLHINVESAKFGHQCSRAFLAASVTLGAVEMLRKRREVGEMFVTQNAIHRITVLEYER